MRSQEAGELSIAPATESDLATILSMVRELAEYEGLLSSVEMTEPMLREALFGPNPAAAALLARWGGAVAGFTVHFPTFSTFTGRRGIWLEDLYVRPGFRRRGIGQALLREVAQVAWRGECGRLEWSALVWNVPAHRVYEAVGAKVLDEWKIYRVRREELAAVAGSADAGSAASLRGRVQE